MTSDNPDSSGTDSRHLSLREEAAEFRKGFVELSGTAFFSMVVAFILTLFTMVWFFSPSALAGVFGDYAARSPQDAEAFATVEALRLADREAERPQLLLFGTSSIAQAFANPNVLKSAMKDYPGVGEWDVHILATPLQTRLDQLTLIETALQNRKPDDPPLVIAIGVGLHRLGPTNARMFELEQSGRLGIRSDWADEMLANLGITPRKRSKIHVVENYKFAVKNATSALLRLAMLRPATRYIDSYARGDEIPRDKRPREATREQIERSQNSAHGYLSFLEELYDRMNEIPNVYLVLLDDRLSPDFLSDFDYLELSNQVYSKLERYATEFGSVFIPMMKNADLTPDDYHDDYHIKSGEPQQHVRAAFAKEFAPFAKQINMVPE